MSFIKLKSITFRFLKAFGAGFFSGLVIVSMNSIHNWTDLQTALNGLALAGVIGGINGVVMAGEKWANWQDTPTV